MDDRARGIEFSGQLREAGVLAARFEVVVEVGEPKLDGAVVEAALLAVDDGEAAADGEPA